MKGKLLWGKRFKRHSWWNSTTHGGNVYFAVPYKLNDGITLRDCRKEIYDALILRCKQDPDMSQCDVEMGSIDNVTSTTPKYVTAICVANERIIFDKLDQYSFVPTI